MLKKIGLGLLATLIVAGVLGVGVIAAQGGVPWARDGARSPFRGRPSGMRDQMGGRGPQLEVLAGALGMTTDEVKEALQDGQTVAEIAEEQGVELEDVVDAVLDVVQEKFDERLVTLEEKLTQYFTEGFPQPQLDTRDWMMAKRGAQLETLSTALGLPVADVGAALKDGQTVAEIAEEQGVELEDVVDAVLADAEENLAEAVENGQLTQEEADEKLANLAENITEHFTEGFPQPRLDTRDWMMAKRGAQLETLSTALGLPVADVGAALRDGQTVAEIAEEQGVELEDVVDAVLADAEEKMAQAVENGQLTQEEADEKLANLAENITEHFTEGFPQLRQGQRRPTPGRRP